MLSKFSKFYNFYFNPKVMDITDGNPVLISYVDEWNKNNPYYLDSELNFTHNREEAAQFILSKSLADNNKIINDGESINIRYGNYYLMIDEYGVPNMVNNGIPSPIIITHTNNDDIIYPLKYGMSFYFNVFDSNFLRFDWGYSSSPSRTGIPKFKKNKIPKLSMKQINHFEKNSYTFNLEHPSMNNYSKATKQKFKFFEGKQGLILLMILLTVLILSYLAQKI